jgi:ATP phosphoribosyltransferase regulatory subunit HisZ
VRILCPDPGRQQENDAMSLFDSILGQVGDHPTVTNMAEKLGIDPEMAAKAVAALGEGHQAPGDTIDVAAQKTGMDKAVLNQIVEQIGGEGSLGRFASMLDADGDGNPLDDIAGFAGKLFGKK